MDDHFERLQHSDPESWRIVCDIVRTLNELNDAIAPMRSQADEPSHAKRSESPMPQGIFHVGDLRYAQRRLTSITVWWDGKNSVPYRPERRGPYKRRSFVALSASGERS